MSEWMKRWGQDGQCRITGELLEEIGRLEWIWMLPDCPNAAARGNSLPFCPRQLASFAPKSSLFLCLENSPRVELNDQNNNASWTHGCIEEWMSEGVKMQLDLNENDWHSTLQKQKIYKRTGNYCQSEIPQSLEDLGVEGRKWRMMWDYMEIWNDQPTDSPLSNTVNRYAIHSSTFSVQSKYSRVRSDLFSSNFSSSLSLPLLELHRIFQSAIWYKARSRF